ncbi:hypothetical protein IWQ62_005152 [Dispira parvispora]|uniref:Uncharacterized protein n=1 Tax=Dispira parvispora TaxID=1520584 RepID=A0A9W8E4Z4_9FUNG|nr:hypothetical protein IWQ62_005152 [Dispira parvispora]
MRHHDQPFWIQDPAGSRSPSFTFDSSDTESQSRDMTEDSAVDKLAYFWPTPGSAPQSAGKHSADSHYSSSPPSSMPLFRFNSDLSNASNGWSDMVESATSLHSNDDSRTWQPCDLCALPSHACVCQTASTGSYSEPSSQFSYAPSPVDFDPDGMSCNGCGYALDQCICSIA